MRTLSALCALVLLVGCDRLTGGDKGDAGGDSKDGKSGKADDGGEGASGAKADEAGGDDNSMKVAEDGADIDGPVPPDTSMAFFVVENELVPLGCFDKDKKSIASGDACLGMVKEGDDARLASHDSQYTRKLGGRVEPECLAGSGNKSGLSAEGVTGGADFLYGTWPVSGIKVVKTVSKETLQPSSLNLSDDEKAKLGAAIKAAGGGGGEVEAYQVAEFDLDGNDKPDKFFAAFIAHPTEENQYNWSGGFVAPDGDIGGLFLVASSKSKKDVFELRGTVQLDGAGNSEMWIRMDFDEGAGDRLFKIDGKKSTPIGEWTCGAGV